MDGGWMPVGKYRSKCFPHPAEKSAPRENLRSDRGHSRLHVCPEATSQIPSGTLSLHNSISAVTLTLSGPSFTVLTDCDGWICSCSAAWSPSISRHIHAVLSRRDSCTTLCLTSSSVWKSQIFAVSLLPSVHQPVPWKKKQHSSLWVRARQSLLSTDTDYVTSFRTRSDAWRIRISFTLCGCMFRFTGEKMLKETHMMMRTVTPPRCVMMCYVCVKRSSV